MLALDWANSELSPSADTLCQFDFVFFIELRYANDNSSIENIIIKQHGLTDKNNDGRN